jgi:FAD-NAD(P)-binding
MTRRLVIVGGGMTGVAAFVAAVRHRVAARIDMLDPLPVGTGTAFAATDPALLCNTSAGIMSLRRNDPDDFLHYLAGAGYPASVDDFVPRSHAGAYARHRYRTAAAEHVWSGGCHRHVRARATAIAPTSQGWYRIRLDDGSSLDATHVFLCRGFTEPRVPEVLAPHLDHPLAFRSPFPEQAMLAALPPEARVLALGTKLSGIDAALLLCRARHQVTMASPSGELPAVRTRTGRPSTAMAIDFSALDLAGCAPVELSQRLTNLVRSAALAVRGRPLDSQITTTVDTVARLRAEIELAAAGRTDWQDLLCAFVDAANAALTPAPAPVRDLVMAHCRNGVARYLTAFPLQNARTLLGHLDAGRLSIRTGVPVGMYPGPDWRVRWRDGSEERFDAVVGAAGYQPPRLRTDGHELLLDGHPRGDHLPELHPDLRVSLPSSTRPERIWRLGIESAARVPSISAVYPLVQQVDRVCGQLAQLAGSCQEVVRIQSQ